jgi:CHAT domain-containing protein/tetratricopeptide (TPR) repeat protein
MSRLKQAISVLIFISGCLSVSLANEQQDSVYNLFIKFRDLNKSGDFLGAEKCMLNVLKSEKKLSPAYIIPAYNNLGIIKKSLGLYTEALDYYNKAENLANNEKDNYAVLAGIYNNKSRIYTFRGSYSTAIEFLEKAVRLYQSLENPDNKIMHDLSTAYLNIGIVYYDIKDYRSALENLQKSLQLKLKYSLADIELTYLNLAKTYFQIGNINKTEEYFGKCFTSFGIKPGNNYYRLAEAYFNYGLFLHSAGRFEEALETFKKALIICRRNYGEKHTAVAIAHKHLGDEYLAQADYGTALEYYQKSLISVVNDFNNSDIFSNPSVDSSFLDVQLLDNLKSKARALELRANTDNDRAVKLKTINASLMTADLAIQLIDRIRNNYLTEENRIYLEENEKETYLSSIHIARALFALTGDSQVKKKIYGIAQRAKAAVLRNEITRNELLYNAGFPYSTRNKQNRLAGNIAAYNNLVLQESREPKPDSIKLSLWKDALFTMNREMEKLTVEIDREFPQYRALLQKTEPVTLAEIQKHLGRDETIVDYLLSNQYKDGKRDLYTFVITKKALEFGETSVDSLFLKNASIIRNACQHPGNNNFTEFTGALASMYGNLIKPIEGLFEGKKLIIIPDEEIAWLPFDALLEKEPGSFQADYEALQYLIYDYSISYCYSSSLIFSNSFRVKGGEEVLSFAPYYGASGNPGLAADTLRGAGKEIESVYRWFRGSMFTGNHATETNFRLAMLKPAVFHLAMHSVSDTTDSRYSYLLFDTHNDSLDDGRLYNYEISLSRLRSPMVVLSACNSGTGTLYHGEGLMSLARGFILAGASSVIRTSWEVNDEVSADIISRFYHFLAQGKHKDDALRLAKLGYLKESPPAYSSPYFWAAYEVLGNNAPVKHRFDALELIIITGVIITAAILILYLRRRRIFSDRSL